MFGGLQFSSGVSAEGSWLVCSAALHSGIICEYIRKDSSLGRMLGSTCQYEWRKAQPDMLPCFILYKAAMMARPVAYELFRASSVVLQVCRVSDIVSNLETTSLASYFRLEEHYIVAIVSCYSGVASSVFFAQGVFGTSKVVALIKMSGPVPPWGTCANG